MSILVTGANGLLGQKLVQLLLAKNELFMATGRGGSRIPLEGIRYRPLDITRGDQVMRVIGEEKPAVVIHTAAMTNVDQCEQDKEGCWLQNVTAVENLAAACKAHGSFLLHLSTDFIFDGENGPYTEAALPNPVSYYGESKLAAEKVVMESGAEWAIARTVLVYGVAFDMSRSNIILWVKKSLEEGKTINVVNDQWRTPTLAEDLAMGCYLIAKKRAKGIFNVSGKDLLNPYQMAIATADYFGLDKLLINETDGSKFSQPARRPPKTGFIIDKARIELGFEPHSFAEGIKVVAGQVVA